MLSVKRLVVLGIAALVAGCGGETPKPAITPPAPIPETLSLTSVGFADLPGWQQDDVSAAVPALRRSCAVLAKQPDDKPVGPDGVGGTVADWRAACGELSALPDRDTATTRAFFERRFRPFRAGNRDDTDGLFTGYFEMELHGSRQQGGRYQTPLYRRPDDLITVDLGDFRADWKGQKIAGRVVSGRLKPYPARSEIDQGALAKRGLELVWVDDRIDAFFLEIQGSGRVILPDGSVLRVGYEAANGQAYVPIGRELVARGLIPKDQVSMQTIRAWLAAHPAEAPGVMAVNPSFVFFREVKGEGPVGAQGVALTAGRSMAVDPGFLPLGIPLWLQIDQGTLPDGPIRRLVVAQDTGGAIKGPVRGDLFWGYGKEAGEKAGVMKGRGVYYLLLPEAVAARRRITS